MTRLTSAQRRVLEHIAANPGRLRDAHSRRDFPSAVCRYDVLWRLIRDGLVEVPRLTASHTYELTPAGRSALTLAGETP